MTMLELGQLYPDPTGLAVVVPGPVPEAAYLDKSVCVSGTIVADEGTPTIRAADLNSLVVLASDRP